MPIKKALIHSVTESHSFHLGGLVGDEALSAAETIGQHDLLPSYL